MLIIPRIKIQNGQCVSFGNRQENTLDVYSDDLADVVGRWFDKGIKRIHLLDLDGEEQGSPQNFELICQIAFRFPNLVIQVSGGISTLADIEKYLKSGIAFVTLAANAFEAPEFIIKASNIYPQKILVSIDSKQGIIVAGKGSGPSNVDVINFASRFDQPNLAGLIYCEEPNFEYGINIDTVAQLAALLTIPVLVYGDIEDMDDITALYAESHKGLVGVICDSELNKGSLDLLEAQAYCDEFEN